VSRRAQEQARANYHDPNISMRQLPLQGEGGSQKDGVITV